MDDKSQRLSQLIKLHYYYKDKYDIFSLLRWQHRWLRVVLIIGQANHLSHHFMCYEEKLVNKLLNY